MHLRDLGLKPGAEVELAVRAVDGAGNVGAAGRGRGPRLRPRSRAAPGRPDPAVLAATAPLPKLGGGEVAVIDELDKVQPDHGRADPARRPAAISPPITSGTPASTAIRLHAARNEFVAFQVLS